MTCQWCGSKQTFYDNPDKNIHECNDCHRLYEIIKERPDVALSMVQYYINRKRRGDFRRGDFKGE